MLLSSVTKFPGLSAIKTGLLISVSVGSLVGTSVWAQEAQVAGEIDGGVQFASLEKITVSATKRPVDVFTFPGSVSVIDRAEIEALQPSSISDVFEGVPGLVFEGGPRRTGEVPALRGISGEGVIVLIDGVKQNFLSGHDGRFFVDADLIQSAEVVRGPFSAVYGAGALGGVISLRTVSASDLLAPGEVAGYRVKTGYQSVNEEWLGGATAFAQSGDGTFDALANITYREAGDIALSSGFDLPSDDQIVSGMLKGTYRPLSAFETSLNWVRYDGDAIEPNNGQDVTATDQVDKSITSDLVRLNATYSPDDNAWVDADGVLFYNKSEVSEDEIGSTRSLLREVETIGANFDNRSAIVDAEGFELALTFGAEYYEDSQVGRDNTTADGTRGGVPDADATTAGAFLQSEARIKTGFGDVLLVPAVRYDSFENSSVDGASFDDSAISPKVGLTYLPVPGLLFFANYAEAFRAPSLDELYADGTHFEIVLGPTTVAPNFFIPNADLVPEESETWELGAGLDLADFFGQGTSFVLKGSIYESEVDDLINLTVDTIFSDACFAPVPGTCTSGTSQYVNTAKAELKGIEIEANYEGQYIFIDAAYGSVTGRDKETGAYTGSLLPDRINITAGAKLASWNARVGVRAELATQFDRVNSSAEQRDGYEVFDLFYAWSPMQGTLEGLRVDLGIDNVFDSEYERVFAGVAEPGRNFKASVQWSGRF